MRKHLNKFVAFVIASAIVAGATKLWNARKAAPTQA